MKKAISPVVCAGLLFTLSKLFNPQMQVVGIFLVVVFGAALGLFLNSLIFKQKASNDQKDSDANI